MESKLVIKPEILEYQFKPPFLEVGSDLITSRLNRNKIVLTKEIKSEFEAFFKHRGLEQYFQEWFVKNLPNASGIINLQRNTDIYCENIYINTHANNPESILVGDYKLEDLKKFDKCRWLSKEDLKHESGKLIKTSDIEKVLNKYGRLSSWFTVFETTINLQVEPNKSAEMLSEYLSKFLIGDKFEIQDSYLASNSYNEANFEKYIYPYIKGKELTLIIPIEDGAKHKKRLENKYKATVKCFPIKDIHQSHIKSETYTIELGYRFEIFGFKGKTAREKIIISRT